MMMVVGGEDKNLITVMILKMVVVMMGVILAMVIR